MQQAACTKVLFLDIDGVLNKENTVEGVKETRKDRITGEEEIHVYTGLDKVLVDRYLSWLKDKDDLDVVLSSDWRKYPGFRDILNDNGIFWEDVTPVFNHNRGTEINHWLYKHPWYTHIAILDDNIRMKPVAKYFVQTSIYHGLQTKHLRKVNKLLGYE